MHETGRVLLSAAVLSVTGLAVFAWRVSRLAPDDSARLIGELRLAHVAATLLAALGAVPVGLAIGAPGIANAHLDVSLGIAFVVFAGWTLFQPPQDALLWLSLGFLIHALANMAHQPGWLPHEIIPQWYALSSASYDVCVAGLCYVARRR